MANSYKPAPELTDQQKLDLIRGTQERMQKSLGIDPTRSFADNLYHMQNHPDAEIRRRFGNLGTAPSTVDPVTYQRGLGEQAEFVAFALRDFGAEAGKLDSYAQPKFLTDKLDRAKGLDDWMAPLKPGQVWRDDIDAQAAQKVAEMEQARAARQDSDLNRMLAGLDGAKTKPQKTTEASPMLRPEDVWANFGRVPAFEQPAGEEERAPANQGLPVESPEAEAAPRPESRPSETPETEPRRRPAPTTARQISQMQDDLATALADGTAAEWSDPDRRAAQEFLRRDAAAEWKEPKARADLMRIAAEMGQKMESSSIRPGDPALRPRVLDRQVFEKPQAQPPVTATPPAENGDGRADGRAQRLERLEALQARVREAREQGVTDGWSFEQQNLAATFAIRNLRADLGNGQQDAIRAEVQALRPLMKGQDPGRDARSTAQPRQDFATATFPSSWNDKTRFPEAEPPAYEGPGFTVKIRPGGPSWNGSPGFGDQTQIPETRTASYDVSIRRSSQPSFSAAAAPRPPAPVQPAYDAPSARDLQQTGGYASRNMDNGITWSGGRLAPQFGHAVQDPGPPPGWPGRTPGYEEPSSPLGGLLQGAAAFAAHKHAGDMDWDDRRDLRRGLRAAGFDPRDPVGNAAASVISPLVKGLGL